MFENEKFLEWATLLSKRDAFQNMLDSIAGIHAMTGQWPDFIQVQEILQNYSAIPNYGADGATDLDGDGFSSLQERVFRTSDQDPTDFPNSAFNIGAFVDDTLSSRAFTNIHGPVQELTPPATGQD